MAVEPGGWFWGGFGGVLVLEAGRLGGVHIVLQAGGAGWCCAPGGRAGLVPIVL